MPLPGQAGIRHNDLLGYYRDMAEIMLPYLSARALVTRADDDGNCAIAAHHPSTPGGVPGCMDTVTLDSTSPDPKKNHIVCNDAATLAYVVEKGAISLHTWLSRVSAPQFHDRIVFDLDPPAGQGAFNLVREGAFRLRELLEALALKPYLITTGRRGVHVVVPIRPVMAISAVHDIAEAIATILARRHPDQLTTEPRKKRRGYRLFIGHWRNAYAQSAVAPYSARALPGAPVATPLKWEELNDDSLRADSYNIDNIGERLTQNPDPWLTLDRDRRHPYEALTLLARLRWPAD